MLRSHDRHLLTSPCSWGGLAFPYTEPVLSLLWSRTSSLTARKVPKDRAHQSRGTLVSRISSFSSSRIQLQGMIHGLKHTVPVQVLVDSRADDNFKTYNIPTHTLPSPRQVLAVDGNLRVDYAKTEPLKPLLSSNHHEYIELLVISSPLNSVVLGIPWLKLHNPHVDWSTATIRNWTLHCHAHCLRSALPARSTNPSPAAVEIDLTNVRPDYHDLRQVLVRLPPHLYLSIELMTVP